MLRSRDPWKDDGKSRDSCRDHGMQGTIFVWSCRHLGDFLDSFTWFWTLGLKICKGASSGKFNHNQITSLLIVIMFLVTLIKNSFAVLDNFPKPTQIFLIYLSNKQLSAVLIVANLEAVFLNLPKSERKTLVFSRDFLLCLFHPKILISQLGISQFFIMRT